MASGSQVWSGNWPLLPMQAMKSATAPQVSTDLYCESPASAQRQIPSMLNPEYWSWRPLALIHFWALRPTMAVPTSSPISPVRTVKNALREALLFALSSHQ
ncbi:unannotated protein [freshwater metagenome]|uniref:Unannotated protein n=1 Tax=freshwater metagenome TaxID=449393 RepID=A0A6J6YCL4_9ZZZZ